ncbi:MAG: prolyl oligopeptidase family serine peptidase [Pseudohongiella sp.]|nr:prolyl oligopeptidase family serine peptidase [Pseudohongiella sp.]
MLRLLKFLSISLCLLVSTALSASEIVHKTFASKTLDRDYTYNIYLPDGYQNSGLSYSVLYLLHGNLGTEESWVGQGHIQQTADQLIAAQKIKPQLIVVPADPKFWWADGVEEKALTAFVQDLVPHIDTSYRTLARREGRSIGGYSAGGFGTVNIALQYPEMFAAAAPLSPAVYAPIPPESSSATRQDTFLTNGKFDADLWASKNWVSFIDAYKAKGIVVPFYINTGDHDRYDIAYFAAVFYQQLREHQPDFTELRIFDGDHNFAAWGATVGNAMEYMSGFILAPQ